MHSVDNYWLQFSVKCIDFKHQSKTDTKLAMIYPVDAKESFEEDIIISNNNILDINAKNPATDKTLSIKDEKKEKLEIVEGDVIHGVSQ